MKKKYEKPEVKHEKKTIKHVVHQEKPEPIAKVVEEKATGVLCECGKPAESGHHQCSACLYRT